MSDLLVAAAAVDGRAPSQDLAAFSNQQRNEHVESINVPCVDDMEIAAAAAAACALSVESSSEDSSGGESSDIDESSSQEPMSPMSVASVEKNGSKEDNCLTVSLVVSELGEVQLHVSETCTVANAGGLMEIDSTQEGQVADLQLENSDESEGEADLCRLEMMREMKEILEKPPEVIPADAGLQLPALESMESVEVDELDILDPAGTITSVVEGMAVVKAHELSKPLEIGSVLSTGCRTALGRVQEIFGPVISPFYIVQLINKDAPEDIIKPNAAVFSIARHAKYIIPEDLNQPGPRDDRDADCDDDLSDEDDEAAKAKGEEMPPLIGGHAFLKERRMRKAKRQTQSKTHSHQMALDIRGRDSESQKELPAAKSIEGLDDPPPPQQIPLPVFSSPQTQDQCWPQPPRPHAWHPYPAQQPLGTFQACPDCSVTGPPAWMGPTAQHWNGHPVHAQYAPPPGAYGHSPADNFNIQMQLQQYNAGQGLHPQSNAGYRPFSGHIRPRAPYPGFGTSQECPNQLGDGPPPGLE